MTVVAAVLVFAGMVAVTLLGVRVLLRAGVWRPREHRAHRARPGVPVRARAGGVGGLGPRALRA